MEKLTFESHDPCTAASTSSTATEQGPSELMTDGAEAQSPASETLKIDTGSPSASQKLHLGDQCWFPDKEQASDTCKWLKENYEPGDGYSLPKSLIYNHYYAFCQEKEFVPVNTASFGKVIRHAFPQLKTRRLGSRGQSKYHYYGIKVKSSSADFHSLASEQRVVPPTSTKPSDTVKSQVSRKQDDFVLVAPNQVQPSGAFQLHPQLYSALICASSSFLPDFPDASNLNISSEISAGQVNYLISSYRSHCVQILETVLRGGLNDVGFLIKHFWQHLNDSCRCMLTHPYLADTIAICDTYLYHTIVSVLLPGTVQPLPAKHHCSLRYLGVPHHLCLSFYQGQDNH
ncbi:Transcription factor RFX4 [Holothuria leucospilota]|uniref:Transcription factor RFX4 n=1 Tax=Holothuria leucospilota TaxID=206669 RepID=A0A9Q1BQE0_HOLLE|nr:Transcription factor RFX4 [Holothuria leucospilota]